MAQYIDKDTLVSEIEKLMNNYSELPTRNPYEDGLKDGRLIGYKDALYKINSLESKEVDLEKEVIDWWNAHYSIKDYPFEGHAGHYLENSTVIEIAKHFFEFGLKVKGE